jgi:hypothetical protein
MKIKLVRKVPLEEALTTYFSKAKRENICDVIIEAKNQLGEFIFKLLPEVTAMQLKLPVANQKKADRNPVQNAIVAEISRKISGCQKRCPLCGTGCTQANEHDIHKSDFHSFPALCGFTENGIANNTRTCENIMYYKQKVQEDFRFPKLVEAEVFFNNHGWDVKGLPGLVIEKKIAFGSWVIAKYMKERQQPLRINYSSITGWRNEEDLSDERRENFYNLAKEYVRDNMKSYNKLND